MVGVAVQPVPQHLDVDACASSSGAVQRLQEQHAGAFPGEDPLAILVEGLTGQRGYGPQSIEARKRLPADRIGAPTDHVVHFATLNEIKGVPDGIVARGAGGGKDHRFPIQVQFPIHGDRQLAGRNLPHERRGQPFQPGLHPLSGQEIDELRFAIRGAYRAAGPGSGQPTRIDLGVLNSHSGSGGRELARPAPPRGI